MNEIWKKIKDFEDYAVSNFGRVKSLKFGKEKILKPATQSRGYLYVNLWKNGKIKIMTVHKLVAIAFLNHKPNGMKSVINHKDFNRTNNRLGNLEITTQRDNTNKKHLKSESKFIGVYFDKHAKKWKSQINANGNQMHLGLFANEEEAGEMYQLALANISLYNGNAKQFRETLKQIQ